MNVEIKWRYIGSDNDPMWDWSRVLYAYLDPDGKEILYIGKAVGTTLRGRWNRSAKAGFWDDLEEKRGLESHRVIVGAFILGPGRRLSAQLIADVESLLIMRLQPWGNIQSTRTRISRPGMQVVSKGPWFGKRKEYRDS